MDTPSSWNQRVALGFIGLTVSGKLAIAASTYIDELFFEWVDRYLITPWFLAANLAILGWALRIYMSKAGSARARFALKISMFMDALLLILWSLVALGMTLSGE